MLWECFWGHFWPKAALQLSLLSVRVHTSCEESKLLSFQCWVLYRPTEPGVGPQHSETHHLTCCETRRCEYTVSNKGGLPCHCLGDCGGYAPMPYILWGQLPPPPLPQFHRLCSPLVVDWVSTTSGSAWEKKQMVGYSLDRNVVKYS